MKKIYGNTGEGFRPFYEPCFRCLFLSIRAMEDSHNRSVEYMFYQNHDQPLILYHDQLASAFFKVSLPCAPIILNSGDQLTDICFIWRCHSHDINMPMYPQFASMGAHCMNDNDCAQLAPGRMVTTKHKSHKIISKSGYRITKG